MTSEHESNRAANRQRPPMEWVPEDWIFEGQRPEDWALAGEANRPGGGFQFRHVEGPVVFIPWSLAHAIARHPAFAESALRGGEAVAGKTGERS